MPEKVRRYEEIVRAVDRAARALPSLEVVELGVVSAASERYPFYRLTLPAQAGSAAGVPRVYLSGGIHGDEPGGVWAVLEFLNRFPTLPEPYRRIEYLILPCTNPFGYEHNTRTNADGLDLNRQFRATAPPIEVELVKRAVGPTPFLLAMEFHEDVDTPGFYVYELVQKGFPGMGRKMLSRIGGRYPVNRHSLIEGLPAEDGLIRPAGADGNLTRWIKEREEWPQAFYHFSNGSRYCFTTETPIFLKREERSEIHLLALEVGLQSLWEP